MSTIDDELRDRYDEASPPLLAISKQLQRGMYGAASGPAKGRQADRSLYGTAFGYTLFAAQ